MATEKTQILDINHWTVKGYRQQMTREELRAAIKKNGDNIMRLGRICYLRSQPLGAGMYNVWFEPNDKETKKRGG